MMGNMANALTLSRILLIPVFIYFLFSSEQLSVYIAASIFGIAAMTDWFDGWVARRYNSVTNFGILIDPLADRLLIIFSVIGLFVRLEGAMPLMVLVVIAARDTLILSGYSLLRKRSKYIPVSYIGKLATALMFFSFFGLILGIDIKALLQPSLMVLYTGVALYCLSFVDYVFKAAKMLRSERQGRAS